MSARFDHWYCIIVLVLSRFFVNLRAISSCAHASREENENFS